MKSRKKVIMVGLMIVALVFVVTLVAIVLDGLIDKTGQADVAIVLGSKVETSGLPSDRLSARLDKAIKLREEGLFSYIIVSGGIGKEGFDEAVVMKKYLIEHHVPAEAVIVDNAGINTRATAVKAAQIMNEKNMQSALVISQYFHISRVKLALRRQGIAKVYSAHAIFWESRDVYSTGREVFAFYGYLLH